MLPKIVDVTAVTGRQITGKLTSWQTHDGSYNVEHIAGMGHGRELLVFWWSPKHDWQVVDVTQKTRIKIAGSVTSWQTPNGQYEVEHLAGMSLAGDLVVFWWSPQHDWQAVNVSQKTGQKVSSPITSWQVHEGSYNVEHLASMAPNGDLLVFSWSPQHDWQAVNVSQKTGQKIVGSVTNWQTSVDNNNFQHLAGMNKSGDLLVFSWSPQHDWQVVNISWNTGQKIAGPVTSWQTLVDSNNVEHLAAMSTDGDLLVFSSALNNGWKVNNVSHMTGEKIFGAPTAYLLKEGQEAVELLAAKNHDGSLILFWMKPSLNWQALSLSDITGLKICSDPCSWLTPDGNRIIEHIAAEGPNHSLVVFWGNSEARLLTDTVQSPFQQLRFLRNVRRKVVAVLWNAGQTDSLPSAQSIESIIFGFSQSVRDFYLQNSNGFFTIDKAEVLGWYQADKPSNHYFVDPIDNTDSDGDGWINGHIEKWAEGIRKAAADFNFSVYDINQYDGNLSPEELTVLFVMPGTYPFGTVRSLLGREYPLPMPLVVNGVTIGQVAEVYIGGLQKWPLNLGVVAHELAHLLVTGGADDMYFPFFQPFAAGDYSLMDNCYKTNHFDPFVKLKSGWLRPRLILHTGKYTLPDIETSHTVWVLMDPNRTTKEYFIIENRWPGNSYDIQMPDKGIGVWHIMEDPAVYGEVTPPPGVSAEDWATVGKSDWGRRAIRMIRPVIAKPFNNGKALWDGSDAATGYDLLSVDPNPQHPTLCWADGTPSGFALRSFSAAGENMSVTVEVPF